MPMLQAKFFYLLIWIDDNRILSIRTPRLNSEKELNFEIEPTEHVFYESTFKPKITQTFIQTNKPQRKHLSCFVEYQR